VNDPPAENRLPFSRESDVSANREAHISPRQQVELWYSGLWRLLGGLPAAGIGAVVALEPEFLTMAIGIVFVATGLYLSWRGFSFLGDSITRNVAYVSGGITPESRTYRGSTTYYMVVGPVKTRISRRTYRTLPAGLNCHMYYASGSRHLLSLEPATAEEPHPSLRFGGDAAHTWDRLRWRMIIAAVAAFGLATGLHAIAIAHPAQPLLVTGRISSYEETTGRGAYRHLYLDTTSQEFYLDTRSAYSPAIPDLGPYIGDQVNVYFNAGTAGDVLALRLRETLYAGDYYLHPDHQKDNMISSGATIALLSGIALAAALLWQQLVRVKRAVAPDIGS
jgi:hypothetical protein